MPAPRRHVTVMPHAGLRLAYGVGMSARVGGRNRASTWVVGILCAGIVGCLLWLSMPAGPGFVVVLERLLDSTIP